MGSMNFPLTPFFDRSDFEAGIPRCQLGFIDFMVLPLYEAIAQLLPEVHDVCFPNIKELHDHFDNILHPNKMDDGEGDSDLDNLVAPKGRLSKFKTMMVRSPTKAKGRRGSALGSAFSGGFVGGLMRTLRKRGGKDTHKGSPSI